MQFASGIVCAGRILIPSMKTTYISFIFLLVAFASQAQSRDNSFRGAELGFTYSVHLLDINSFNNSLRVNRLPALARSANSAGIWGGIFINRFWFGGEAAWQFNASGSNDDYLLDLYGGNGMVKAGYIIIERPRFSFYPAVGVGGGGLTITVSSPPNGSVVDNGMIVPGKNLHSGYMLVDPALNADFFFGDNEGPSRLFLGFSLGYLITPLQTSWEYGDDAMPSLRKFGPQGLYVKLKAGWNKIK